MLGAPLPRSGWEAATAARALHTAGLCVTERREDTAATAFSDVGAPVCFLRAGPRQVPGFCAECYREPLDRLHARMAEGAPFTARAHRFPLAAALPG